MRVLHFAGSYFPVFGGTTTRLHNMLSGADNEHELFVLWLADALQSSIGPSKTPPMIRNVLMACICLLISINYLYPVKEKKHYFVDRYTQNIEMYREISEYLKPLRTEQENLGVSHYNAGSLAYYSKWRFVDIVGLNHRKIAREGFQAKTLFDERPDLMIMSSDSPTTITKRVYAHIVANDYMTVQHPGIDEYIHLGSAAPISGKNNLHFWVCKESTAYAQIVATFVKYIRKHKGVVFMEQE